MKKLPFLFLILFACSEDDQKSQELQPLTPYEQSDKDLRPLLFQFSDVLNEEYNAYPGAADTTDIVLKYKSTPFAGTNLTEITEEEGVTTITFHKEFLQLFDARGYNLRLMYLIHVAMNRPWECIGPFRELKTQQDVDGFNIMVDTNAWGCGQPNQLDCCPVIITTDSSTDDPMCWDRDVRAYWFKDVMRSDDGDTDVRNYKSYLDTNWDFSRLENLYTEAGIPTCNK